MRDAPLPLAREAGFLFMGQKRETPSGEIPEGVSELSRRRPTFPRSCPRSIIGDEELDCRVRNGNGYDLFSMTTGNFKFWLVGTELNTGSVKRTLERRYHEIKAFMVKSDDRLVLVS